MREIKFRAWDKDKQEWVYFPIQKLIFADSYHANSVSLENWTQFTGLLDKNGKEIYEGDIVRWTKWQIGSVMANENSYKNSEIIFSRGAWVAKGSESWNFSIYSDTEVIGNIYENPELVDNSI